MFGVDAEYIMRTKSGIFVSAHRLAEKGHYVTIGNAEIGRDGVFLEVATKPTHCRMLLLRNLFAGVRSGSKLLGGSGTLVPEHASLLRIPAKQYKALPESAHVAGCAASLNCYGDNRGPEAGTMLGPTRHSGLHFHFSLLPNRGIHENRARYIIRALDRMVGLPSVLMDPFPKQAAARRVLYGEAGCYRFRKVNGQNVLEYRVPSGALALCPAAIHALAGLMQRTVWGINDAKWASKAEARDLTTLGIPDTEVRDVINESDTKGARALLAHVYKSKMFGTWISNEFDDHGGYDYRISLTAPRIATIFREMGESPVFLPARLPVAGSSYTFLEKHAPKSWRIKDPDERRNWWTY